MSLISVIVPVYKVERYLHRCINSILDQTFTNFELILVDDGSPDNCGKICDEYAEQNSFIHVIHQKNKGLSGARNTGIEWILQNSNSEWLTFIDSDDWVHPQYLQLLIDAIVQTKTKVSICGYINTNKEQLEIYNIDESFEVLETKQFYIKNNVNATVAWGKLYHKSCFSKVRFPEGKLHEDEYVTYQVLFDCDKIVYVSSTLYFYFINPKSIMHKQFSISRYDSVLAAEQRICFFKQRKMDDMTEWAEKDVSNRIALFSIMARKNKKYKQVPDKYKIGLFKALKILYKNLSVNQYEYIVFQYYPFIVRMQAYYRKIAKWLRSEKN